VVVVVDIKAKAPKGKEKIDPNAPKGPFAVWTRITLSDASPLSPRYMHNCFVANGNDQESFKFFVFGGIASSGPQLLSEVHEVTINKNATTGKYALDGPDFTLSPRKELKVHSDNADNFSSFSAVTVPICASFGGTSEGPVESSPAHVMVLIVDGSRELRVKNKHQQGRVVDSNNYLFVLDETSRLVRRVRKAILNNHQSSSLNDSLTNGTEETKSSSQVVEFENGDRYEGEVFEGSGTAPLELDEEVETQTERGQGIPHGRGVMSYANNDVYEVECSFFV
jgi:hypothetical protein